MQSFRGATRETGEGWPLLTVETEANGDSKSTNERGHLSWALSCPALAALVGPSTKYVFHHRRPFQSFVFIAQQAGQAVVPGRLSLNIFLWGRHPLSSIMEILN